MVWMAFPESTSSVVRRSLVPILTNHSDTYEFTDMIFPNTKWTNYEYFIKQVIYYKPMTNLLQTDDYKPRLNLLQTES